MKVIITFFGLFLMSAFSAHSQDIYLDWASQLISPGESGNKVIAVDNSGNVYTGGYFEGTTDFDPGPGVSNLSSSANRDSYLCKLDALGNFVWAIVISSSPFDDYVHGAALDASGNIYVAGVEGTDGIVQKISPAGSVIWSKNFIGNSWTTAFAIAVDLSGNVYTTGRFLITTDFDPGAGTFNMNASATGDLFISKLDANGDFVFAKRIGGSDSQFGYSIAVNSSSEIFLTGLFKGPDTDFDTGAGVYTLFADGTDGFICKLSNTGDFLWAQRMTDQSYNRGNSITVDASGNSYVCGYYSNSLNVSPGPNGVVLTSNGSNKGLQSAIHSSFFKLGFPCSCSRTPFTHIAYELWTSFTRIESLFSPFGKLIFIR